MSAIFEEFCFFQRFVLHVALKKRRFFGPRHTPSPDSFLHRFFMIFETILAPKSLQNGFREGLRKEYNFWYLILTIFDDFGPPRGPPKEAQNSIFKRAVGPWSAIFSSFFEIVASSAAGRPSGPPNAPQITQNAPKITQNLPTMHPKSFKISQSSIAN